MNSFRASTSTVSAAANISRNNPATAAISTSAFAGPWRKYSPGGNYSVDSLIAFAAHDKTYLGYLTSLANDLASCLANGNINSRQRFEVGAALAFLLPEGTTVNYLGKPRGDSYFANLAVDVYLGNQDLAGNSELKSKFIAVVDRWVNHIAPSRTEFPLQGFKLSRSDVNAWLTDMRTASVRPRLSNRFIKDIGPQQASSEMASLMLGQSGDREQSVHDKRIQLFGWQIFRKMKAAINPNDIKSFDDVSDEIRGSARGVDQPSMVDAGLTVVSRHNATPDEDSEVHISPCQALRALWTYTTQHREECVRNNLIHATLLCLGEIGVEKPCFTGCTERILNVPNGIDPFVSVVEAHVGYAEDVSRLAARVQSALPHIFEGTELENPDAIEGLDEEVYSEIKTGLFKCAAKTELGLARNLPENQFSTEVEKMVPGFAS